VLWHAAVDADLLVVGTDDQRPVAEAVTGSVPGTLLTTAPSPLAVVPHAETAVRDSTPY
jgi:nucleotide-binding universal stress UspA family protein